jgi:hypothetical protein
LDWWSLGMGGLDWPGRGEKGGGYGRFHNRLDWRGGGDKRGGDYDRFHTSLLLDV